MDYEIKGWQRSVSFTVSDLEVQSATKKETLVLFEVNLFHDQGHRCYILFVRSEKTRGAYDLAGDRDCLGSTSRFGTENSEFVASGIGHIKRI